MTKIGLVWGREEQGMASVFSARTDSHSPWSLLINVCACVRTCVSPPDRAVLVPLYPAASQPPRGMSEPGWQPALKLLFLVSCGLSPMDTAVPLRGDGFSTDELTAEWD